MKILWFILLAMCIGAAIFNAVQGDAAMTMLCCTAYLVAYMEARHGQD